MRTQYKIGEKIVEAKENQGKFHDDIKLYFDTHLKNEFTAIKHEVFSHVNGDHGRIETRKVWLITDIGWQKEDSRRDRYD